MVVPEAPTTTPDAPPLPPSDKNPPEYVGYLLLGHLVETRRERPAGAGLTATQLTREITGLAGEREERVREVLDSLEVRKLVVSTESDGARRFEATPDGVAWYAETAHLFQAAFERYTRNEPSR